MLELRDWIKHDSYNVFDLPLVNPDEGERTLVVDRADTAGGSPFGWHDTDGLPGAETNNTSGNNVFAQDDIDGNNFGGLQPVGMPVRVFNYPAIVTQQPDQVLSAAIVNLFYWNNLLHDIHYRYGFNEAAGNFQLDNYGSGGMAGDRVRADAQDGDKVNNATFATPPDGTQGIMQMHLWVEPSTLDVNAPSAIAGSYVHGTAAFGAAPQPQGVTGDIVLTIPADACTPITNGPLTGEIALIDRGTCLFVDKVAAAQAAGAAAVIIANHNPGEGVINMAGDDPAITIRSLFISFEDGALIKAQLPGENATLAGNLRDGAFDNGIIIHEYGHGVSIRRTGGPGSSSCLDTVHGGGMGEGWGDWWALALTAMAGDQRADPRGIGNWSIGESGDTKGIRRFPYSTDMAINPHSFESIKLSTEVHDVGEVWAAALWEVFWTLVDARGFDPDVHAGSGGNNLALQLVMDALPLHGCEPTFLVARDAILQADEDLAMATGESHKCRLWLAFAKRGLGDDATASSNPNNVAAVSNGFSLKPECAVCGDVDDSEAVDLLDVVLVRRAQAALGPGLFAPEKCNTSGPADPADADQDGLADDCDAPDIAAMRETLAGIAPGIAQVCGPAVGISR